MPWQSKPVLSISPDALTAKVLCRRHNAALSPLDAHALRIYEELGKASCHATKRSLSRRNYAGIVSGEPFELWALKTMAGRYCSPTSANSAWGRRNSNSLFDRLRQRDRPFLWYVADDQMAAPVARPPREREIAAALRMHRGVGRLVGDDAEQDRRA